MDWIAQYQRGARVFGLMAVMVTALAAGPPEGEDPETWCEEIPKHASHGAMLIRQMRPAASRNVECGAWV